MESECVENGSALGAGALRLYYSENFLSDPSQRTNSNSGAPLYLFSAGIRRVFILSRSTGAICFLIA